MDKYEVIIYWSDEDSAYLAEAPELPGCVAHGDTHESALANLRNATQLWIRAATEFGDPVPAPKGRRRAGGASSGFPFFTHTPPVVGNTAANIGYKQRWR